MRPARPEAPRPTQDLQLTADENGVARELAQFQVYLTMGRRPGQRRHAVVRAVRTCAGDQVRDVLEDFRFFVGTLTVDLRRG